MERVALLAVCCLVMPVLSYPLYPALRFGQRASSILVSTSMGGPTLLLSPVDMRNHDRKESQEAEYRSGRHADAIFTNSYRKVLGQISARRFLQTIMGKRLDIENYVKRESDVYEDLTTIQREQRYRGQQRGVHRLRCNACASERSHSDLSPSGDVGDLKLD